MCTMRGSRHDDGAGAHRFHGDRCGALRHAACAGADRYAATAGLSRVRVAAHRRDHRAIAQQTNRTPTAQRVTARIGRSTKSGTRTAR